MPSTWERRGQAVVDGAAGLGAGLIGGFKSLGRRIKAAKHRPTFEAFCAQAGHVAAQNGQVKPEEVEGFKQFMLQNRDNPVFSAFSAEEAVEIFKSYAVKAFMGETDPFITILDPIDRGSDEANLVITGCLAIAFADGDCDDKERACIESIAGQLSVNIAQLAASMQLSLPAPGVHPPAALPAAAPAQVIPAPVAAQPAPVAAAPAPAPQGKPCGMCKGSGKNAQGGTCPFCKGNGYM